MCLVENKTFLKNIIRYCAHTKKSSFEIWGRSEITQKISSRFLSVFLIDFKTAKFRRNINGSVFILIAKHIIFLRVHCNNKTNKQKTDDFSQIVLANGMRVQFIVFKWKRFRKFRKKSFFW